MPKANKNEDWDGADPGEAPVPTVPTVPQASPKQDVRTDAPDADEVLPSDFAQALQLLEKRTNELQDADAKNAASDDPGIRRRNKARYAAALDRLNRIKAHVHAMQQGGKTVIVNANDMVAHPGFNRELIKNQLREARACSDPLFAELYHEFLALKEALQNRLKQQ